MKVTTSEDQQAPEAVLRRCRNAIGSTLRYGRHHATELRGIIHDSGLRAFALIGLLSSLGGCANMNHAQSGALFGTALGTAAGAAIGSDSGHAGAGALIGAMAGGMAGGVIGDAEDARIERDIAYAQRDTAVAQASYIAQSQQALTNMDLVRLSQSGVSDQVIVNMIQSRGGRFELGTEAIIALKTSGVSDAVIVAAQSAPPPTGVPVPAPAVTAPTGPGVVVMPPPAVIVEPPPPPVFWGWGYHHHHHRRHRPGSHVDLYFGF